MQGESRCPILCENEGVGPRQGNNAAQLFPPLPMTGGTADEGVVASALPRVKLVLAEFERLAAGGSHLVGATASLADFYLGPIFAYLTGTPESAGLLADKPKLQAWWKAYSATPAMAATAPQFG